MLNQLSGLLSDYIFMVWFGAASTRPYPWSRKYVATAKFMEVRYFCVALTRRRNRWIDNISSATLETPQCDQYSNDNNSEASAVVVTVLITLRDGSN